MCFSSILGSSFTSSRMKMPILHWYECVDLGMEYRRVESIFAVEEERVEAIDPGSEEVLLRLSLSGIGSSMLDCMRLDRFWCRASSLEMSSSSTAELLLNASCVGVIATKISSPVILFITGEIDGSAILGSVTSCTVENRERFEANKYCLPAILSSSK